MARNSCHKPRHAEQFALGKASRTFILPRTFESAQSCEQLSFVQIGTSENIMRGRRQRGGEQRPPRRRPYPMQHRNAQTFARSHSGVDLIFPYVAFATIGKAISDSYAACAWAIGYVRYGIFEKRCLPCAKHIPPTICVCFDALVSPSIQEDRMIRASDYSCWTYTDHT